MKKEIVGGITGITRAKKDVTGITRAKKENYVCTR